MTTSDTTFDLFDLTDKVAIVTGGSRGLGREICIAFAEHGAKVVVASRKIEACEALVAELDKIAPGSAKAIACHVGRWADCDSLIDQTMEHYGQIDILVNNAGIAPLYPSIDEVSEELFDKVIDVNLKGPFRLSALASRHMAATGGGSIINVSSTASLQPSPGEIPYATAKGGINVLTKALAHMLGPSIRVNAIMPGPFLTDISNAWDLDQFNERARTQIPLRRGGQAREICGAALYFASEASSYTTGSILKVDGGSAWSPA